MPSSSKPSSSQPTWAKTLTSIHPTPLPTYAHQSKNNEDPYVCDGTKGIPKGYDTCLHDYGTVILKKELRKPKYSNNYYQQVDDYAQYDKSYRYTCNFLLKVNMSLLEMFYPICALIIIKIGNSLPVFFKKTKSTPNLAKRNAQVLYFGSILYELRRLWIRLSSCAQAKCNCQLTPDTNSDCQTPFYSKLPYSKLPYSKLPYSKLSHAKLSHAELSYSKLSNAKLSYAKLSHILWISFAKLSHILWISFAKLSYILWISYAVLPFFILLSGMWL